MSYMQADSGTTVQRMDSESETKNRDLQISEVRNVRDGTIMDKIGLSSTQNTTATTDYVFFSYD